MSYVQITRTPGHGRAEYDRVRREMGPATPAGLSAHHVGVVDGALVTVDVWDSRAAADRFAAETLFPAMERAGVSPSATTGVTAFESDQSGVPA
ncbi:hypothetical protein [Pseudonocardia endophytica]|uniref:ABM domain-containing protein n=1 Tax=Pseudonocardia endophytica TaxID=401976 RepID=A0A4R1HZK8_PSEEN|nr:hypothetical protein [Pseudonocardia endophytica]TCK27868.1 hypothetical protein EV378_3750 [Pseudonocardia endophytica]